MIRETNIMQFVIKHFNQLAIVNMSLSLRDHAQIPETVYLVPVNVTMDFQEMIVNLHVSKQDKTEKSSVFMASMRCS